MLPAITFAINKYMSIDLIFGRFVDDFYHQMPIELFLARSAIVAVYYGG